MLKFFNAYRKVLDQRGWVIKQGFRKVDGPFKWGIDADYAMRRLTGHL